MLAMSRARNAQYTTDYRTDATSGGHDEVYGLSLVETGARRRVWRIKNVIAATVVDRKRHGEAAAAAAAAATITEHFSVTNAQGAPRADEELGALNLGTKSGDGSPDEVMQRPKF